MGAHILPAVNYNFGSSNTVASVVCVRCDLRPPHVGGPKRGVHLDDMGGGGVLGCRPLVSQQAVLEVC